MSPDAFIIFLVQIAVMLACGVACGQVMRWLHQPAVLGEMVGGIILGPTVSGMLFPDAANWLFPAGDVKLVSSGAIKLGLLFFLFSIGLEIEIGSLRKHGISALLIGIIGTAIPLAAGVAIVYLFPDIWGIAEERHRLPFALFIGTTLANTANPVLARILLDLGQLKKNLGAVLMTASVIDDLISWSLLALIVTQFEGTNADATIAGSIASGVMTMGALAVMVFLVGRYLLTPIANFTYSRMPQPGGMISLVIVFALLAAAGAEKLGVHAFFGTFLLGMTLAPTAEKYRQEYEVMNQFVMAFFVPIYFVSMGLSANFVTNFNGTLVAVVFVAACVSKISAAFIAAKLSGLDTRTSLAVGFGMNARGAIGIILAGIGLDQGVIDQRTYVALVVMALGTSIMAGPLMKLFLTASPTLDADLVQEPRGTT